MRSRLLMTVSAAALIAGAGFATAQDRGGPAAAPQGSSPAQQSAPPASQPGGGSTKGGSEIQQRQEAPPVRAQQQQQDRGDQMQRAQEPREQRQNRAQERSSPKADKNATDTKSDRKGATTGQGSAGSQAALTGEQRTKISSTIRQTNVKRETNVNFNVAVGTVVPRTVTLHALPPTVVEVYPQWRGYRFVMIGDEIVIIDPGSHRIVAVIEA